MISLTVREIRRIFSKLVNNNQFSISLILTWSAWRRKHQAVAKYYHYQKRLRFS
jgi:hypothetical protein